MGKRDQKLPNNHSLGRSQVHTIALLHIEGSIPLGEVSGRHIGTQVARTMDIHLQKQSLVLGLCLLAPHTSPVCKVFLEGNTLGIGHNVQGNSHTAVVGDVFADGKLAVADTPGQLDAIELLDHGIHLLVELPLVSLGPPVVQIAQLVALGAVGVEGVGDFVADDGADAAQVLASGLMDGVERCLQNGGGEGDVIDEGFSGSASNNRGSPCRRCGTSGLVLCRHRRCHHRDTPKSGASCTHDCPGAFSHWAWP